MREQDQLEEQREGLPGRAVSRPAILVLIGALALAALPAAANPSSSAASVRGASAGKCKPSRTPVPPPQLPRSIVRLGAHYAGSHARMPRAPVKRILAVVWRRLYHKCHHHKISRSRLRYRVSGNLRQIGRDSGFIPAARSPTGQHAKGLLQLIKPVFAAWRIPHHRHVTNPLDDILAGVNIQLHADRVVSVHERGYTYPHNVLN